jgi:hypothetical protein
MQVAQIKDLRWRKGQPQTTRGSNQRPPMEKEATLKCKGLKSKTSDEKKATTKCKGLKSETSDGKRGNVNAQEDQKSEIVSSPKPASPN